LGLGARFCKTGREEKGLAHQGDIDVDASGRREPGSMSDGLALILDGGMVADLGGGVPAPW